MKAAVRADTINICRLCTDKSYGFGLRALGFGKNLVT
jgi:hypothetical protein